MVIPEVGIRDSEASGIWNINIHCGNCGDQEPIRKIGNFRDIEDTGNDWAMTFDYEFHGNE